MRFKEGLLALLEGLFRNIAGLAQFLRALQFRRREVEAGLVTHHRRLRLAQRGVEGLVVDLEQEIAGIDLLAVGERDLCQLARDLRADLDIGGRFETPGKLNPVDDLARHGFRHRDRRRGWGLCDDYGRSEDGESGNGRKERAQHKDACEMETSICW